MSVALVGAASATSLASLLVLQLRGCLSTGDVGDSGQQAGQEQQQAGHTLGEQDRPSSRPDVQVDRVAGSITVAGLAAGSR